ncbi:MAG: hypothetical protein JXA71_15805 [Chitinispirillaceae bacterium]|nr:hypothetical protein [Chitinispirillaceae bacterium]
MKKYLTVFAAAAFLLFGCSTVNTEKCLQKEGFKSCEDLKAAAEKAVGNDEVIRFHNVAKKCRCGEIDTLDVKRGPR